MFPTPKKRIKRKNSTSVHCLVLVLWPPKQVKLLATDSDKLPCVEEPTTEAVYTLEQNLSIN